MNTPISKNRRAVLKTLTVVFAVFGILWGGGMVFVLIQGFTEHEGYHKREFEEALPMLSLLTVIGIGFLFAAWFFWRLSRRGATHRYDHAA